MWTYADFFELSEGWGKPLPFARVVMKRSVRLLHEALKLPEENRLQVDGPKPYTIVYSRNTGNSSLTVTEQGYTQVLNLLVGVGDRVLPNHMYTIEVDCYERFGRANLEPYRYPLNGRFYVRVSTSVRDSLDATAKLPNDADWAKPKTLPDLWTCEVTNDLTAADDDQLLKALVLDGFRNRAMANF
jgi:hypothetical protein